VRVMRKEGGRLCVVLMDTVLMYEFTCVLTAVVLV
jgi:hypothetical protein